MGGVGDRSSPLKSTIKESAASICGSSAPLSPCLVRADDFFREEAPHTLFGNRAAARLGLGKPQEALEDAEVSVGVCNI